MGRSNIEGWITLETAKTILKMGGQDFEALKKQALTREFRPVPLNLQASLGVRARGRPSSRTYARGMVPRTARNTR